MPKKTKAEKREEKRTKARRKIKGGTLAGQKVRIKTAKGYSGQKESEIEIKIKK